jgi:hypothetical protein
MPTTRNMQSEGWKIINHISLAYQNNVFTAMPLDSLQNFWQGAGNLHALMAKK